MFKSLSSFKSGGLSYRFLNEDDKSFFVSLYTSPEVMRYICKIFSREKAEFIFEKLKRGNCKDRSRQFVWVVEANGDQIGVVGLSKVSGDWDLGAVMSLDSAGKGWGTKAMSKLLSEVFEAYPIDKVTGRILANNSIALRAVRKLGFEYMGNVGAGTEEWMLKRENFKNGS